MAVKAIRRPLRPKWRSPVAIPVILAMMCAGCLPSSCHRIEPRDIAPEDSLSRQLAQSLTPDTITSHTAYTGTAEQMLEWPRTVLLDDEGHVYVGDTKRHSIFTFETDGTLKYEFSWPDARFPYLAGWRGDTLVVFTPDESQASVNYVIDTLRVRSFDSPSVPRGTLQYATTSLAYVFVKAVTQADTHFVWQLNHHGLVETEVRLVGSSWDHAGFLRANEQSLFSLTGFFPRMTYWNEGLGGAPEQMRLRGFDSPMLRRTWAYSKGSGRNAPLLTSSAVWAGEYWFVLNLRPGWLRVDVYDAGGALQNILIEEDPSYLKQFYPIDIAVWKVTDNVYDMVVALVADVPVVRRYSWTAQ